MATPSPAPTTTVSFKDALKFWTKLGFISFGGPAGQIVIMHQEVVVAVVIEAVLRIGKKALKLRVLYIFAALAFVAIYALGVPFPAIVAAAALGGLFMQRRRPEVFCKGTFDAQSRDCRMEDDGPQGGRPSWAHVVKVALVCAVLWLAVVGCLWAWRGADGTLTQLGLFFTKAAFVTFGGAYAVLSYITEVAVSNGWLSTQQMLIGLGLAESTPGPLIMVTQYAGFLAAWNLPGGLHPLTACILRALVTTYVTFLPCFFFIFAGAPFIEAMAGNQRLQAALTGVTAAVVTRVRGVRGSALGSRALRFLSGLGINALDQLGVALVDHAALELE